MGKGEPPLLLIHGLGGDCNAWAFNHATLAADRRVLAIELPGHGGSEKDVGDGSLPTLADALLAFMDAASLGRAHLLGLSFGGAVALDLALRHPERALSLGCVSSCGLGPEVDTGFIRGYFRAATATAMRTELRRLFAGPARVTAAMVSYALAVRKIPGLWPCIERILAANFPGERQRHVYRDRLTALAMPMQVIWGSADRILPVAHARDLPPGIETHILAGVGHVPNLEAAGRFNALVRAFLARYQDRSASGCLP